MASREVNEALRRLDERRAEQLGRAKVARSTAEGHFGSAIHELNRFTALPGGAFDFDVRGFMSACLAVVEAHHEWEQAHARHQALSQLDLTLD